jgi:hypothetical protein
LAPSNRKRKKGLKKAEPSAGAAARRIYAFTAFRIVTDTGGVIHLGIKKLGRIGSIGHRITGRYPGAINRHRSIGWEFVHVCIDDASRVAFVHLLADQRKESPVAYLQAAVAYYAKLGILIERVPPVLMRTTWIACSRSFAPSMAAALGHRARAIGSDVSGDEVPRGGGVVLACVGLAAPLMAPDRRCAHV